MSSITFINNSSARPQEPKVNDKNATDLRASLLGRGIIQDATAHLSFAYGANGSMYVIATENHGQKKTMIGSGIGEKRLSPQEVRWVKTLLGPRPDLREIYRQSPDEEVPNTELPNPKDLRVDPEQLRRNQEHLDERERDCYNRKQGRNGPKKTNIEKNAEFLKKIERHKAHPEDKRSRSSSFSSSSSSSSDTDSIPPTHFPKQQKKERDKNQENRQLYSNDQRELRGRSLNRKGPENLPPQVSPFLQNIGPESNLEENTAEGDRQHVAPGNTLSAVAQGIVNAVPVVLTIGSIARAAGSYATSMLAGQSQQTTPSILVHNSNPLVNEFLAVEEAPPLPTPLQHQPSPNPFSASLAEDFANQEKIQEEETVQRRLNVLKEHLNISESSASTQSQKIEFPNKLLTASSNSLVTQFLITENEDTALAQPQQITLSDQALVIKVDSPENNDPTLTQSEALSPTPLQQEPFPQPLATNTNSLENNDSTQIQSAALAPDQTQEVAVKANDTATPSSEEKTQVQREDHTDLRRDREEKLRQFFLSIRAKL